MKTLIASILWLSVYLVFGLQQHSQNTNWRQAFKVILANPPSSSSTPKVVRNKKTLTYSLPRRPTSKLVSTRVKADVRADGNTFQAEAFIQDGKTYVGLRAFLQELYDRYGIDLKALYQGGNRVEVKLDDDELFFGKGLAQLWNGRVSSALVEFDRSATRSGKFAVAAKEFAAWIREETDPKSLPAVGVVRIEWWNLPRDVNVFIEEFLVPHGAPLMLLPAGVYELRLVDSRSQTFLVQRFMVKPDDVFAVLFKPGSK